MINETITMSQTVEGALLQGALALGLTKEEVEYQILEEPKKGFLGFGSKMAKVLVYRRGYVPGTDAKKEAEAKAKAEAAITQSTPAQAPQTKAKEAPSVPTPSAPQPKTEEKQSAQKKSVKTAVTEENHPAVALVKTLIADFGIDATVTFTAATAEDESSHIDIVGNPQGEAEVGVGALIGHHGDTMEAIQYLANIASNRQEDEAFPKVKVDVEGYRQRREETLCRLAQRTAHRALKYHRNFALEPMNAYERRIIHAELQKVEGVSTHSVGSGTARRVVVVCEDGDRASMS